MTYKKFNTLILIFFPANLAKAQKIEYNALNMPSIKENANAVVRLNQIDIISSQR
jgi:hypothetical protein